MGMRCVEERFMGVGARKAMFAFGGSVDDGRTGFASAEKG